MLVGAIGAVYAFLAPRHYSVQSVLRPAAIKDLDELNHTGVYELSPGQALAKVAAALDSYENRLNYFSDKRELLEPLTREGRAFEQTFEAFNDSAFRMLRPDPRQQEAGTPFVGLQLTYPENIDGVEVLNGFVAYSIEAVRRQIAADLNTLINNRLGQLDRRIEAARASYEASKEIKIAKLSEADSLKRALLEDELKALRQELKARRENRIQQLDEAIRIAKALAITKPTTPSSLGESERSVQGSVVRTEINNQQIPLYFMGSDALKAERDALSQRSSDDFTEPRIAQIDKELQLLEHNREIEVLESREREDLFLKGLAAWREEAARLRGISVDASDLNLVTVDQRAIEPMQPVKPKAAMIVVLALLLGAMLAIFVALIRSLATRRVQSPI